MAYCHTCDRNYHYLGIARHRRGHLDRGENCTITFKDGATYSYRPVNAVPNAPHGDPDTPDTPTTGDRN